MMAYDCWRIQSVKRSQSGHTVRRYSSCDNAQTSTAVMTREDSKFLLLPTLCSDFNRPRLNKKNRVVVVYLSCFTYLLSSSKGIARDRISTCE